jgi:cell division septal protein FtsQ
VTERASERRRRRHRRNVRRRALRWLAGLLLAGALFALGVAVGEALHDNPRPGLTTTSLTTVNP